MAHNDLRSTNLKVTTSLEFVESDDIYTVKFSYRSLPRYHEYREYLRKIVNKLTKYGTNRSILNDPALLHRRLRDALDLIDQIETIKVISGVEISDDEESHMIFASIHVTDLVFITGLLSRIDSLVCEEVNKFDYNRFSHLGCYQHIFNFVEEMILCTNASTRMYHIIKNSSWFKHLFNTNKRLYHLNNYTKKFKDEIVISFISPDIKISDDKDRFMKSVKKFLNIYINSNLTHTIPDDCSKEALSWLINEGRKFYTDKMLLDNVKSEVHKIIDDIKVKSN